MILTTKNGIRFWMQLAHGITEKRQILGFFRGFEQHERRCSPWG
jgi:hypothetical protein